MYNYGEKAFVAYAGVAGDESEGTVVHFAQHLILSWFIGEGAGLDDVNDRRIVALAGVVPDLDVIPYVGAAAYNYFGEGMPLRDGVFRAYREVHMQVHHVWTHGIGFVLVTGLLALFLSRLLHRRSSSGPPEEEAAPVSDIGVAGKVAVLAMIASVLHVLGDVLASGPDWPVFPLMPFSRVSWGYAWSWSLADWPNLLILGLCLLAARQYAVWRGRSVVEVVSVRLDRAFVRLVRNERSESE